MCHFFPLLPIHFWKNFKMLEFSGKWWSCFLLSWGSGWETSGLFFVWFPGVTVTDPCAQVGCCVYPAWVTILLFRQFHKVLGRLSAAPGPRGRCSPRRLRCPSCPEVAGMRTVVVRAGGAAPGARTGLCPPGRESELCQGGSGVPALPVPARLSSAWVCISAECGDCHTKGSPSSLHVPGTAGDFGKS